MIAVSALAPRRRGRRNAPPGKRRIAAYLHETVPSYWRTHMGENDPLSGPWTGKSAGVGAAFDALAHAFSLGLQDLHPEWAVFADMDDDDLPSALICAAGYETYVIEIKSSLRVIYIGDGEAIPLQHHEAGERLLGKIAMIAADVFGARPTARRNWFDA